MKGLITICLALCACGGRPSKPRVRIADLGPTVQMHFLPITAAEALGYYKDEGLEVTLEKLPSTVKTLEALLGGSADVAAVGYLQSIQMAAQGQRIRTFFIGTNRVNFVLVVPAGTHRKIGHIEDLAGSLIGVPSSGGPTHQWVNYYLIRHGLNPADTRPVGIGDGPTAVAALESGRVDVGALTGGTHIRYLRGHPEARVLLDGSSPDSMRELFGGDLFAGGTLTARQEWLERNPEITRRLCRALQRALHWIATHSPEEIRKLLPEASRSADEASDLEIIRWGRAGLTPDGRMPHGAPEAMKRFLDATSEQVRGAKIDLAATWTNEFLEAAK